MIEKTQEFVDSIKSEYLDVVFINFKQVYWEVVTAVKKIVDQIPPFNLDGISKLWEPIMDRIIELTHQLNNAIYGLVQQTSEEVQARTSNGKFEIDLLFHFQD